MALRLVNNLPGTLQEPFKPGQPVHLGLKETASSVRIGSIEVSNGSTSLELDGNLPEVSPVLSNLGAEVSYVTTEHRQPFTGSVPKSIVSNNVVFAKSTNDSSEKCLYEVSVPTKQDSSAMGYVKFKKAAWTQYAPDWCNLTAMAGPYFALEHGSFDTAIYGFLRNNGTGGSLVLGGPMQNFSTVRPGQVEIALAWTALPNGTDIELWFFFNTQGYTPAFAPVVEVWCRIGGVAGPVRVALVLMSTLGSFRLNTFPNFRGGSEEKLVLTFGLAGKTGDTLTVSDWKLFPDYRHSVLEGAGAAATELLLAPDCLVTYRASSGLTPEQIVPGRWFPSTARPDATLYRPPGKVTAYALHMEKASSAGTFHKEEPRLETGEGAFIEAFMYGAQTTRVSDVFGGGLALDDGTKLFQVVMLETDTFRTLGISRDGTELISGFYTPASHIDWSSPKLVRLAVDKTRAVVSLFVDEVLELEVPTSGVFPATVASVGTVMFGHVVANAAKGHSRFVEVNYSPRYRSYALAEQVLPTVAPYSWTLVGPADVLSLSSSYLAAPAPNATGVVVDKENPSKTGSAIYYSRADDFSEDKGFFVDFQTEVNFYADAAGHSFGSSTVIHTGVDVQLGTKVLSFRFCECGALGKYIGILPGSGSWDDILNQTSLGKVFSFPFNWEPTTKFRILFKRGVGIQVWAGTLMQQPLINIPWRGPTDGFDLPLNVTTPSISFGHLSDLTVSDVKWYSFEYGISNGYEVAISHQYEGDLPAYLFGGAAFVRSEFDV